MGCLVVMGSEAVCLRFWSSLVYFVISAFGCLLGEPNPEEPKVIAGGLGALREETEEEIEQLQIDCTATGESYELCILFVVPWVILWSRKLVKVWPNHLSFSPCCS